MSDEFDIFHANHDETQEMVDWAVAAAALVVILQNSPEHTNPEEGALRLENYVYCVNSMWLNMPTALVNAAIVRAADAVEESLEDERQIEEFREELEGFKGLEDPE